MGLKPHKDTLELASYLSHQELGKTISYLQIESDTGITMNTEGKNKLRSALKIGNILSITRKGVGIEIVSKDTCIEAISIQFSKVNKAVYRGRTVTQNVISKHLNELDSDSRQTVLVADAALGAIQANSETRAFMDSLRKKKAIKYSETPVNVAALIKR